MRTIALVARGALTYHGRAVAPGELFEAAPVDAAVLRYHRQVDFAPRGSRRTPPTPPPAPAPAPPIPDRTPTEDIGDPPADEEKPARKRRVYRRRDLEAEDSCSSSD